MESNYKSSLVLSRANANIRSVAAQITEDSDARKLRQLYTSLAVYSKRALRTINEATGERAKDS